eukprot:sb/3466120/
MRFWVISNLIGRGLRCCRNFCQISSLPRSARKKEEDSRFPFRFDITDLLNSEEIGTAQFRVYKVKGSRTKEVHGYLSVLVQSQCVPCDDVEGVGTLAGEAALHGTPIQRIRCHQTPRFQGKQPIRTLNLGYVTGYQPMIMDQYFLIRSVQNIIEGLIYNGCSLGREQEPIETSKRQIRIRYLGHVTGYQPIGDQYFLIRSVLGRQRGCSGRVPSLITYVMDDYTPPKDERDTRDSRQFDESTTYDTSSTACQKRALYIDFTSLGWRWIVAPRGFDAFMCSGEYTTKNRPSQKILVPDWLITSHAVMESMYPSIPKPCCSPTKLTKLLLFVLLQKRNRPNQEILVPDWLITSHVT